MTDMTDRQRFIADVVDHWLYAGRDLAEVDRLFRTHPVTDLAALAAQCAGDWEDDNDPRPTVEELTEELDRHARVFLDRRYHVEELSDLVSRDPGLAELSPDDAALLRRWCRTDGRTPGRLAAVIMAAVHRARVVGALDDDIDDDFTAGADCRLCGGMRNPDRIDHAADCPERQA